MKLILLTTAAVAFFSCNPAAKNAEEKKDTATTAAIATDGPWQSLFDGKTTKGWHTYGKATVGTDWKIEDGALYLDTAARKNGKAVDAGNIVTDEAFENFHLKLEWKISPNGIFLHIKHDATVAIRRNFPF